MFIRAQRTKRRAAHVCIVAAGVALAWGLSRQASSQEPGKQAELVGAGKCLECHTNRESFKENIHARAWPKAKGIPFEKSCETCHGPGSLHAEAAGDKSNPGFATIRNPKKLAADQVPCLDCHVGGKQALWKGSTHQSRGLSCLNCHSIHSGHPKNMAKAVQPEVCSQCHKQVQRELGKASHHPIREGKLNCTDCHNPHGTVTGKLIAANSVNEKCYECHTEKRGPFLWQHPPVTENCLNCHKPHGSSREKLLAFKRPYLCQTCHSDSRHPGTLYALKDTQTGASVYTATSNRLFYRGCSNCHSQVHGSNHPSGSKFQR